MKLTEGGEENVRISSHHIMDLELNQLDGPSADLTKIVGVKRFLTLCEVFGGTTVYIPKKKRVLQQIRNRQIEREFEGHNYRMLAEKYGLSERRVRQIINRARLENSKKE